MPSPYLLTLERTTNYPLVRSVVTHPRLWPHMCDDHHNGPRGYQPSTLATYLTVNDENELLGIVAIEPRSVTLYEIHIAFLPIAWGGKGRPSRTKQALRAFLSWIWTETSCQRIVAHIPETNTLALRLALACGLQEYGRNPKSFQKHGRLITLVELGISRPED